MQLSVLPHYQYFSLIRENAEYEKTWMSEIFFYMSINVSHLKGDSWKGV